MSTQRRPSSFTTAAREDEEEEEEAGGLRPRPRRTPEAAPRPGGVALVPALPSPPRARDWPVLEGLGVWGDLELPLEGETFWALGGVLEGWLAAVRLLDTLFCDDR